METSITKLPEGTKFFYKGEEFIVTSREEYPFILTRCLTQPNDYQGYGLMFANFEKVEVPDGTSLKKL